LSPSNGFLSEEITVRPFGSALLLPRWRQTRLLEGYTVRPKLGNQPVAVRRWLVGIEKSTVDLNPLIVRNSDY
jgi:hypothetical protein